MAYDITSKTTVKSNNEGINFYARAYVWSPKHFFLISTSVIIIIIYNDNNDNNIDINNTNVIVIFLS